MKKILSLLLVLTMVLSLAACNKSEDPSDNEDLAVLTMLDKSRDAWVKNFNPFSPNVPDFVQGFMFEYLILFDNYNNNKEYMWLAEDIISEPDNKTLTIKVRKGIKWSDGEDFNADDVVYSYTMTKDHPGLDRNGDWSGDNPKLKSVTKLDDYTVEIVMNEESVFHRLDIPFQKMIIPEHIFSEIADPQTEVIEVPVVTGAFSEVVEFTPEMVVMGRNPHYWKADELKVDQLRLPQYNGNDGALALLQTGEVDWAHNFIPNAETTYVQGDEHRKFWYGMNDAVRVAFNYMTDNENNLKAYNDPEFKKAFSMAVDRTGIIDSAVFGYLDRTVPTVTGLPPALRGYVNPEAQALLEQYTTYDLAAAEQILIDAGYEDADGDGWRDNPDGTPIAIEINSPAGWSDWNDGAVIVAEGLQAIGVNVTAKAIDLGMVIESWESGDRDALYSGYGAPANIWKHYFDTIGDQSRVLTPTWWSITQTNYTNDDLTEMIAEMPNATPERLEEIAAYIELYFQEQMINIPILYNGNWFVYNDSRFTGWATADNPWVQPASVVHDIKIVHLLGLEPVK